MSMVITVIVCVLLILAALTYAAVQFAAWIIEAITTVVYRRVLELREGVAA